MIIFDKLDLWLYIDDKMDVNGKSCSFYSQYNVIFFTLLLLWWFDRMAFILTHGHGRNRNQIGAERWLVGGGESGSHGALAVICIVC